MASSPLLRSCHFANLKLPIDHFD
ncbi:unnamed protein product, partial [Vitis vinifera]|uniref:Uncharacterized protein n=1 Tax=Vitis vinifera TaxID=29760 RepID=D7T3Y4_VITVI